MKNHKKASIFKSFTNKIVNKVIIPVLPNKYSNLLLNSRDGLWNEYYEKVDDYIDNEWDTYIWPLIKEFNFDSVLELAAGAGRNTEKLCEVSKKIYAVEYNAYALDQCKARLGSSHKNCSLEYYVNNGLDLRMIKDDSITTIYCWDAAVHFDKEVLASYIKEFSRILKSGGMGFVHHSNLGNSADKNIRNNPGWRSNMNKELFSKMCMQNNLDVIKQVDITWTKTIDAVTIFRK